MQTQLEVGALIKNAVEVAVREAIDLAVECAQAEVEKKVRASIGSISAKVLEHFSYERMGNNLVITVKFEKS